MYRSLRHFCIWTVRSCTFSTTGVEAEGASTGGIAVCVVVASVVSLPASGIISQMLSVPGLLLYLDRPNHPLPIPSLTMFEMRATEAGSYAFFFARGSWSDNNRLKKSCFRGLLGLSYLCSAKSRLVNSMASVRGMDRGVAVDPIGRADSTVAVEPTVSEPFGRA